jgi:hypothetical protein
MPRHQLAPDEGDDRFNEDPRYERLLQRTDVELAWIYERHPDLKGKISTYQAAKVAAHHALLSSQRVSQPSAAR